MADYNSAYTGAQIDTAVGLAPAHASRHAAGGADAVAPGSIGAEAKRLQFIGTQVPASAFVPSTAYPAFPFQARVPLDGALNDMTPEVVLSAADALSGNFAPVVGTLTGAIVLYAASVPARTTTIPTIMLWKAVQ